MFHDALLLVKKKPNVLFKLLTFVNCFIYFRNIYTLFLYFLNCQLFKLMHNFFALLQTVAEIKFHGGKAVPNFDSVECGHKIVETAITHFGRVGRQLSFIIFNNRFVLK